MKLCDVIKGLAVEKTIGNIEIDVKDVKADSNRVMPGSMFICLKGGDYDGHQYVKQAENYGCGVIVSEKELQCSTTQIIVKDTRVAMSVIASNFFHNADKKLKIIGVIGTNGKTTTTHLIAKILKDAGENCGIIGTLGIFYNDKIIEPTLTTPDPLELHKIFNDIYLSGVTTVVMEVSAHAVFFNKVHGINFEVGVFTNFSRDHLDFFNTMEEYKKVKAKFFENNFCKYIVVNADDDLGIELENRYPKSISYAIENPADVFAMDIKQAKNGQQFILNLFDCVYNVKISLMGLFNVYNVLASATTCALMGVGTNRVVSAIKNIKSVSGRMEKIYDDKFTIYVDYAHTPDGLYKVLSALKCSTKGRLICVFGCGGNRDEGKRKEMGKVSASLADFTVITSDNTRYEEPMSIICEIEKGVLEVSKSYVLVQDRYQATEYAINMAKSGDVIIIAGKGSEKYQEILGIKRPYNDKDSVEEILRRRGK